MTTPLRSQVADQVALDPVRGKVVEAAVEDVVVVGVVALVVAVTGRNQLVRLAERKERPALEQAMVVRIRGPFRVQKKREGRRGMA
jgi:hypothetical protein